MNTPKSPIPPPGLAELQAAFGKAIGTPFLFDEAADEVHTQINVYPAEVVAQMIPRPDKGMSGADRLAIYNQQYWFRLLTIMQKEFPLLRHLIGVYELNKLTTAYLSAYPSQSPSLRYLSDDLGEFLTRDHDWNMPLLQQVVELERIYIQAFDAAQATVLNPAALTAETQVALLQQPLVFQPHWFLFAEDWELVRQRQRIADDPDDELEVDVISNQGFWAIYRHQNRVTEIQLGPIQYQLLTYLAAGKPLESACEDVAAACDEQALAFFQTHIQSWFAHWLNLGWFAAQA